MKRRSGHMLFVFIKHGEKARKLVHFFFAEKAMTRVQIKKYTYTVKNI